MKKSFHLGTIALLSLALALISGCADSGPDHPAPDSVSFGGTFVETENPEVFLTVQDGRFQQGGRDVYVSGSYHAHQITKTAYELHVTYEGKFEGARETLLFRKLDDVYILKNTDDGTETRFKRTE